MEHQPPPASTQQAHSHRHADAKLHAVAPRMIVGDVRRVMAGLPDASFDLIITSPPFLGLRTYLPDSHPDKGLEIGSEATPAEWLDTLLALTAEWGRLLSAHGSLVVELGDTYAGRNRARAPRNHDPAGMRQEQQAFSGPSLDVQETEKHGRVCRDGTAPILNLHGKLQPEAGWPLDKSLCGIPTLYAFSLAYGRNLLTGRPSPAGQWRIRNVKPWVKTNPPVGALADKERPATSYVVVATKSRRRWFDIDAVRVRRCYSPHKDNRGGHNRKGIPGRTTQVMNPIDENGNRIQENALGTPPLDWWHEVDAVLDTALHTHARGHSHPRTARGVDQRPNTGKPASDRRGGNWASLTTQHQGAVSGVRGWHLRRALEDAGILTTLDALTINTRGYRGSHYAVWPEELVRVLVEEMCPRRVCVTCGEPSRRITHTTQRTTGRRTNGTKNAGRKHETATDYPARTEAQVTTEAWTTCRCEGTEPDNPDGWHTGSGWRPGRVLDPFCGSGTTLKVAAQLGRAATGIDLDARNVELAKRRCGPNLTVHERSR